MHEVGAALFDPDKCDFYIKNWKDELETWYMVLGLAKLIQRIVESNSN